MNSLEFIKMHVDEWPSDTFNSVKLLVNGYAYFFDTVLEVVDADVDLSEHFAPDYYDGVVWTRGQFESRGSNSVETTDVIKWKEDGVCYADGEQWFESGHESLVNQFGDSYEYDSIVDLGFDDFQLNEVLQGDCILVDEVDDEDEYNNVVDMFMLFGFPRYEDAGFEDTLKSKWLVVDKDSDLVGVDYLTPDCKRMVRYNQLMVIGKLKKMLNDKLLVSAVDLMGRVLNNLEVWSPTINSIVDVGGCDGVVKAIDGDHCWVLKDTSMYETYHKDSLKKPLSEEEQLYKDVVAALSDAAWITNCESKTAIGRLDKLGYKIVRKGD